MLVGSSPVYAASDEHAGHTAAAVDTGQMNHDAMPGMEHGMPPDGEHQMQAPPDAGAMPAMDHGGHRPTPGAPPASGLRDPHAYAGGYEFSQFPMRHEASQLRLGSLRAERLEAVRADDDTFAAYDVQAWYGGDFDRIVFKAEGDVDAGEVEEAGTELLWGHAIAPFWNTQLGLRYDGGEGPDRSWLAAGVQGLAPYRFELDATAYVGTEGRTALNIEAAYELLITQRLILQPRIETNLLGKRDVERGLGSGLSDVSAGLRLRYELRREIAPYIGVEWAGKFGGTADLARSEGVDAQELQAVAGLRFWF